MACFLAALLYFIWAFFHSEQLCFTGRLSQGDTDPVVVCIFLVTCLTKVGMGKLAFCNSSYHFRSCIRITCFESVIEARCFESNSMLVM